MTRKTIYLHIGRHKTGTSSIQRFLDSEPDLLSELNLYYPDTGKNGIAHHALAQIFSYQNNKSPEMQETSLASSVLTDLRKEIDRQPADVLISSESFQNSDPHLIKAAFADYDLRILVYIRNQIDYLASSYAQKVWATDYSETMDHYYDRVFNPDYLEFLNQWSTASNKNITVRNFSRKSLCDQDIVVDFFVNMLEKNSDDLRHRILTREITDANPSLTADLLAYKIQYNKSNVNCDESKQRMIRQALANLSLSKNGAPVRVTQRLKLLCTEACAPTNKKVSAIYFDGNELFSMDRPTGEPSVLTREYFTAISENLIENDSRISAPILEFTEAMYPTLKAG